MFTALTSDITTPEVIQYFVCALDGESLYRLIVLFT